MAESNDWSGSIRLKTDMPEERAWTLVNLKTLTARALVERLGDGKPHLIEMKVEERDDELSIRVKESPVNFREVRYSMTPEAKCLASQKLDEATTREVIAELWKRMMRKVGGGWGSASARSAGTAGWRSSK